MFCNIMSMNAYPTIPSYIQVLLAMFFICNYFSGWCYMQFRSSGCWQILIYVSPSDSTPILHFLHYITSNWCWYCTDIFTILRPLFEVERGGLLRRSLCDRWAVCSRRRISPKIWAKSGRLPTCMMDEDGLHHCRSRCITQPFCNNLNVKVCTLQDIYSAQRSFRLYFLKPIWMQYVLYV